MRKCHTAAFKAQVVLELLKEERPLSTIVCRSIRDKPVVVPYQTLSESAARAPVNPGNFVTTAFAGPERWRFSRR